MIRKEHRLARLLSGRPGLSRPEKEEILDAVLAATATATAHESAGSRHGFFGVLLAIAAGAIGVVLIGMPSSEPSTADAFTARGRATGPQLTAVCAATSSAGTCATGGELLFELADADAWTHVALFAFREDGTAIWYAPDDERGTSLERDRATALLPRRVRLGDEHPAGRYTVAAVLSRRPLQRPEIREIYESPESHADARVIETEVEIR